MSNTGAGFPVENVARASSSRAAAVQSRGARTRKAAFWRRASLRFSVPCLRISGGRTVCVRVCQTAAGGESGEDAAWDVTGIVGWIGKRY